MTANANGVHSADTLPRGDGRSATATDAGPPAALVLGRYRLLERLGAGGFGVVWRAHDERLDREVAVKRIILAPGDVPDRVTREALASARLAHPAIVALYEAAAEDHAFCLVSELVSGPTLAELIARDELADEQVIAIGLALCDALQHAHERGVVHRDVKPHNVLVPDPASAHPVAAKLADFGGAWITGEDPLTRTGDVMGTLAYMAPEQAEGAEVGVECDLYSCALVCFEALTGVNPVRGATPASTARNIGTELPSLHEYRPDLPGQLVAAIDVALDPVAEQRGNLADLRGAIDAARQPRSRRRSWFAARRTVAPDLDDDDRGEEDVTRVEHARREAIDWPEVNWEAGARETLVAPLERTRPRPAPAPAPRPPRRGPGVAGTRSPSPPPSTAPSPPDGEAPVASSPPLRAPVRLVTGGGAGLLAAIGWYGLGGATQQLALAAGVLTALAVALLPRLGWLAASVALCAGCAAAGAAGSALCVAAAALPVELVLRRPGPAWLAPALAPLLGLAGLAGAFPAVAAQPASWSRRAAVGALGYWWLVLAEVVLGRRLWLGAPTGAEPRGTWEGSIPATVTHALGPLLTTGVLLGALLWAAAAAVLPWLVRGRHVAVDLVAATVWTAAIAAAAPLLDRGGLAPVSGPAPRGLVLGAVLAGLLVVTARGARGAP